MRTSSDAYSLFESGHYGKALVAISELSERRELLTSEQIVWAELLFRTGSVDASISLAEHLLANKELSVSQHCRLRDVLGSSAFRKGQHAKGCEHYKRGIEFAELEGQLGSECALRVHFLRNQNRYLGPHYAAIDLGLIRRKTYQLGDRALSIQFQLALTELAAKLGLHHKANEHLEVAKSLAVTALDRSLHAEVKLAELALAALGSNLVDALQYCFELLEIATETGSASANFGATTNLGHLLIAHARFDEAGSWIQRGLSMHSLGGGAEVALRDTLMSLHMSVGRVQDAGTQAEAISRLLNETSARNSYYGLWHLVTRVKWLYRLGNAEEGVALAMDAMPRIERMADRNLVETMKLLAAEGLGRVGRPGEGVALMADAISANPDPPLEIIAEASRVAGRLAAHDDPAAARAHFDRAGRILLSVGNLTARADIERDVLETTAPGHGSPLPAGGPGRPEDLRPPAAPLVERIAALVDLAALPPLLAAETLTLIADTHTVRHATIVEIHDDGRREYMAAFPASDSPAAIDASTDAVRMTLGRHRNRDYEIAAVPLASTAARATLLSVERLVQTALALARARHQEREQAALWPEQTPEQQLGLVYGSERMLDLITTVRRVAPSNITVLITGETGVGKELFARALHQASARRERPFLPLNCTTVPKEMIDSQLFGYRRGAFTGAHEDFPGLLRAAAGGTLFLDEIGEMSHDTQPKLLRFLESGEILPLGDVRPHLVDVRVVAATNANLDQLVSEGRFREDLYYRLNVIPLRVPPLRERREEIPLLVEHFLDKCCREQQKPPLRVADETLEYLVLHGWPGNVRQLANEIRRMVALAEPGAVLMPAHLSSEIAAGRRTVPVAGRPLEPTEVVVRTDQPMAAAAEHLERAMIQRALALCDGRNEGAARRLGLSRKGLYLKRQRLGIE